jgi:polysaccharide export outer membrane protein
MRLLRKNWPWYLCLLSSLALAAVLPGCGTKAPSKTAGSPPLATNADFQTPLRVGDKIRVELTGIPDPPVAPVDQDIMGDGSITLPYIQSVIAAGKTPIELQKEILSLYVPTWYKHANVTVTPVARFFYVGGQVNNGGSGGRSIYTGPITVIGAIESVGDFTPFADKRHVQITRVNGTIEHVNCVKAIKNPKLDVPIYPGDRIYVPLRKF